jgi:hypothetical protein
VPAEILGRHERGPHLQNSRRPGCWP